MILILICIRYDNIVQAIVQLSDRKVFSGILNIFIYAIQ